MVCFGFSYLFHFFPHYCILTHTEWESDRSLIVLSTLCEADWWVEQSFVGERRAHVFPLEWTTRGGIVTISLVVVGLVLALIGLAGCIIPVIPGPFLSFLALIILSFAKHWEPFSPTFLMIMAGLTLFVSLLDYVAPVFGAKKYGGSKSGVWCSVLGMVLGIFFFPPWGMLFGALVGAILGELVMGVESAKALRDGWGVFIGNMVGVGLKLAASAIMLFFYIVEMF